VLLALLIGCDSFPQVQEQGTIAAYEQYLKENPSSAYRLQAQAELEELYLAEARESGASEAYDRYLERFPQGVYRAKALAEREPALFRWAEQTNTEEAWQRFLDEVPRGDAKRRKAARGFLDVAGYREHLKLGEVQIQQVNLAEDPKGPLDGWGFTVDVTNDGPQVLEYLQLTMYYLDASGDRLDSDTWPVVA